MLQIGFHDKALENRVVSRVTAEALGSDEMGECVQLVIDAVDKRIYHIESNAPRAEGIRCNVITEIAPAHTQPRAADSNIMDIIYKGVIYQPSKHVAFAA